MQATIAVWASCPSSRIPTIRRAELHEALTSYANRRGSRDSQSSSLRAVGLGNTPLSQLTARDQNGLDGIISHASSVVALAGPPFENSLTPMLSAREG